MATGLSALPAGVELRPATSEDRDFLLALYSTVRADELAPVPWTEAEKAAFIESQFDAQDAAYHGAYPNGEFLIVVHAGVRAGRLYLGRLPGELRIIDVTLMPELRGQGLGTRLMAWALERADGEGLAVTLHVEPWNPAKRLYERLGFVSVEPRGIYEFMRRPARAQLKTAS